MLTQRGPSLQTERREPIPGASFPADRSGSAGGALIGFHTWSACLEETSRWPILTPKEDRWGTSQGTRVSLSLGLSLRRHSLPLQT